MAGLVNGDPQRVQTGRGLRLDAVMDTAVLFGLEDIAYRARLTAEQSTQTKLTVAVLGQFKAGKSSLLNDLIEAPLLPVGALPATSVVTVVSYGASARATVTLLSGEERTVGVDELDLYVTEQHNPGNHKKVAQVSLTTPGLAASRDLELVDTPGFGSLFDAANAVTTGWLPHASSALVAVNATQPLSAADLDLIVQLKAFTPDIAIVLTKTDLLTQSELAEVRDFTEQHVRRSAGLDPSVLTHSSRSRDPRTRADLTRYLRRLQGRHLDAVRSTTQHRTSQLVGECRQYLHVALAASRADALVVHQLRASLLAEQTRLHEIHAEARRVVAPIKNSLQALLVRRLTDVAPGVARRAGQSLAAELANWHGSLACETRMFEDWLTGTLTTGLQPHAVDAMQAAAPFLQRADEALARLGQAFAQRLGDDVARALGISVRLARISAPAPRVLPVDVAVSPIFDSRVDMLSWALPMAVLRPLVHRHFMKFLDWQVEKNCLRLAYQTAGVAGEAIDTLTDEYLDTMAERVASCQHLLAELPDGEARITALLEQLDDPSSPSGYAPENDTRQGNPQPQAVMEL